MRALIITICLMAGMNGAQALGARDCTAIASLGERLSCFDKIFPGNGQAASSNKDLRNATDARDCSAIGSAGDRLSCFDKIFAPVVKPTDPKAEYRDITVEENAHLDKSMKTICKDCFK